MKASIITGPGMSRPLNPHSDGGVKDILVKIRACGLCGSDNLYISLAVCRHTRATMPLGHEAAGEIVEVGSDVSGLAVGDHVVINPMARPENIIGNGGTTGAGRLLLLGTPFAGGALKSCRRTSIQVAALNEP